MSSAPGRKCVVLGITGASGAAYARRLVECMVEADVDLHLVVSPNGKRLLSDELAIGDATAAALLGKESDRVTVHPYRDVGAVIGSGSFHTNGMIICPCSTSTMAAVANGLGDNLLNRAAAVTLKESRRLIVVPREMPFSPIDVENCARLSRAGAIICPACPGFYMLPKTIEEIVDFVVGKLLDLLSVPHHLNTRWAQRKN